LPNSADWSLEDNGIFPLNQRFSYADLIGYYAGTVHGISNEVRKRRMALLWQGLGHLVHHIQDMAQPQHVRNDGHCNADQCAEWENYTLGLWDLHRPSAYEEYSKTYLTPEKMQALYSASDYFGNGAGFNFAQQGFLSARDFWLKANQGQADFVSKNFVTVGTNYRVTDLGGSITDLLFVDIDTHPNYPLPNIDSGSMVSSVNRELLTRENICTQQETVGCEISGEFYFVNHSFVDPVTNSEYFLPRFTSFGLWDDELVKRGDKPIFSLNRLNYRDRYESLVPRAIAFSQGLIDFFFRGKISVSRVHSAETGESLGFIRFRNESSFPISGTFTTFSEHHDGTNSLSRSAHNVTLGPGESTENLSLSDFFPSDPLFNGNRAVSFRGDIGGSYGVATFHFSQANQEIPPPPIACGSQINGTRGGSEGLTPPPINMGSVAGTVQVAFEAYSIPDGYEVRRVFDNKKLVSTNGLVSGYHTNSFNHNPDPDNPATFLVDLEVTGNSDTDTAWNITLGCPGDSIPDTRKTVTFEVTGVGFGCSASLYLDGNKERVVGSSSGDFTMKLSAGSAVHVASLRDGTNFCSLGTGNSYFNITIKQNGVEKGTIGVFGGAPLNFTVD